MQASVVVLRCYERERRAALLLVAAVDKSGRVGDVPDQRPTNFMRDGTGRVFPSIRVELLSSGERACKQLRPLSRTKGRVYSAVGAQRFRSQEVELG